MEMQKEPVTRSTSDMRQARGRHPIAVVASEMVLTARSADKNRGTNRGEALAIWYQGCIQLRRCDGSGSRSIVCHIDHSVLRIQYEKLTHITVAIVSIAQARRRLR